MKKAQLVFIPAPRAGHLGSAIEMAKLLAEHDERISITVLVMKSPFDSKVSKFTASLAVSLSKRIKLIDLPTQEQDPKAPLVNLFTSFIESQKPHVRETVSKLTQMESSSESPRLAGIVLDMFCTTMIEVANEFGVPSYIFLTSGAASLGLHFYIQSLHDEQGVDPTQFNYSDATLPLPTLVNPLPAKVLPTTILNKNWLAFVLDHPRKFRQTKGIIINTFEELESQAIKSLSDGKTPPVYPVGPILNLEGPPGHEGGSAGSKEILQWLDDQPALSVVFLCFGSEASFGESQVKEIACALEHCKYRFLWSLRRPSAKDMIESSADYEDPREVLPDGFLDRTAEIGRVIGWAPQAAILAHPAVGGFVSHCGWNSILESLWFGVPIATWPLFAEQQFNAFQMVIDLGLAVEIKMDFRKDDDKDVIMSSEEIERGITCLMEDNSERRKKVKEMSENSKKTLMEGGSSCIWLGRLVEDIINN